MKKVYPSVVVLFVYVGNVEFINVHSDLGASLKIIPLSGVVIIEDPQVESTASTLQIKNKTCSTLVGTIKDVPIQIDKF